MKEGILLLYIKRVRKYYKYIISCKFNNLDEIKQFLESHKEPKITQINNLNSPINMKENESVGKNLSQKKFLDPVVSVANFTKYLKEK